jgi:hypothetical protein
MRVSVCIIFPAVAKSSIGLRALYEAVMTGRPVVYNSRKSGLAVFLNGKAYNIAHRSELRSLPLLINPDTLYISDGLSPEPIYTSGVGAFTLIVSSPKREIWHEFSKSEGCMDPLVIPAFTEAEIMELRDLAFIGKAGCDAQAVLERFEMWGGNVRNVLTKAANPAWYNNLNLAARAMSLDLLARALTGSSSFREAVDSGNIHGLLNLVPCGAVPGSNLSPSDAKYFRFSRYELPSVHVKELVVQELVEKSEQELFRFLHVSADKPTYAAAWGALYEQSIVVQRLISGPRNPADSCLRLDRLSPALSVPPPELLRGASSLELAERLPRVRFRDVEELKTVWNDAHKNAVFVPRSTKFPVVDLVLRLNGQPFLVNATVSDSHGIKVDDPKFRGLLDVVGLGADDVEIPFLWVLPQHAYNRLQRPGQLKSSSDADLISGPSARHPIGRRLAQYKVLLQVP